MKKVDFNVKFKNFKGEYSGNTTISDELALALFNAGIPELPIEKENKYRAYNLCTRLISQNGVIELVDEDIDFLKKYCATSFSAGAFGQVLDLIGG